MIDSIFSPLERETPDTSDISQDESCLKSYMDTASLAQPNTVEDLLPQLDSIVKTDDTVHVLAGLLLSLFATVLDLLSTTNLTIDALIERTQEHLTDDSWRWRFLCYICCHNDVSVLNSSSLQKQMHFSQQCTSIIDRYISQMPIYLKSWSYHDLDLLHRVAKEDLTRANITSNLSNHSPKEVFEILKYLFDDIPWTQPELDLIAKSDEISMLAENLPCRSQQAIEEVVREQTKSIEKSTPDNPKPSNTMEVTEDKSESNEPLKNKDSKEEYDIDEADINYCINTDLTLGTFEEIFPDVPTERIVEVIKSQCNLENKPLTQGEKILMKQYLKEQKPVEEIFDQFPCRSKEFVTLKYREFEFNATRRTKFKNATEKLVYEAQWSAYLSMGGAGGRSSRRLKSKPEIDLDQIQKQAAKIVPVVKTISPEERAERARLAEERRQKQLLKAQQKQELRKERQRLYEQRKALGLIKQRPNKGMGYVLQDVLAGSEHFQSVTGDKKKVEVGQKRRRIQAEHYSPVFEVKKTIRPKLITRERERAKHELKKAKKQEIRDKLKKRKPSTKSRSERLKSESLLEEKELTDGEEEHLDDDDENEVSPFDPTNICTDTLVPLNNRKLYVEEFYQTECSIPKLNFVNSPDHQVMVNSDTQVLYEDNIAYHIIHDYRKNYKSLPVSFPPLYSPNSNEVNPINKLRVRFLLYPQHYEVFLLAAPKSNELDPVYEIIKLIMIHYALYFSHSEEIKKEVMEYCEKIESSIEENNFSEFMFLIDKWNLLMLELSPNTEEVQKIKTDATDVNKMIRDEYLSPQERKIPKLEDLNLELFYSSISQEMSSPAFNVLTKVAQLNSSEVAQKHNVIEPSNVSDTLRYTKPDDYNAKFFKHLQKKSDISRFAMHQLLLRIYSRVVSTDSRKLRSYKAFTAEVYGELLPSFTSEVLEKVQLRPDQKFYDLGSGVGNTTFQAALEFGAKVSGGCEIMEHASKLCSLQANLMSKHLAVFGLRELNFDFALLQSFVDNEPVRKTVLDCDVLIINNYLFDVNLNTEVGRMLYGLKTGTKIISLRNFIRPRYRFTGDSIFDRLRVEKHEMSDFLSVSWTANKVPYYISTVEETILPEYLGNRTSSEEPSGSDHSSVSPVKLESSMSPIESMDVDDSANETKCIDIESSTRNGTSIVS